MKGKFLRKITAALAGALLLAGSIGADVLAADPPGNVTPITVQAAEIKIHVRDADEGAVPGTGAPDSGVANKPVSGAILQYQNVADLVQVNTGSSVQLLYRVSKSSAVIGVNNQPIPIDAVSDPLYDDANYYYLSPETLQEALSDAIGSDPMTFVNELQTMSGWTNTSASNTDGDITVNTGGTGVYLFSEAAMPPGMATVITPFFVSNPMPDTTGNGWLSTIHIYPKVRSTAIDVEKKVEQGTSTVTVDNGGTNTSGAIVAESGTPISHTVTVEIPGVAGQATAFTKFEIKDAFPSGLIFSSGTTPTLTAQKKGTGGALTPISLQGTDYTIDSVTANQISVTMAGNGLTNLTSAGANESVVLTFTYALELNTAAATLGTSGQKSTATVTYERGGGGDRNTTPLEVSVHTYGIDVAKTLSDAADTISAGDIEFELREGSAQGTLVNVAGSNGTYWKAATGGSTLAVGAGTGSNLTVHGLEPGTYVLTETKTKAGYSGLAAPITIVITAPVAPETPATADITATADGETATVTSGAVQLGIVNTKISTGFTLPKTGDEGMMILVVIGSGMICSALVFLAVYRRRNEKR